MSAVTTPKPGVLAVMIEAGNNLAICCGNEMAAPLRASRATVEQLALVLAKIVFDWDGEPEDMQDAKDVLAAFRGEQA